MTNILLSTLIVSCLSALFAAHLSAEENQEIKLWPNTVPGDEQFIPPTPKITEPEASSDIVRIKLVTEPTITLYRAPADKANGTTVLICPGGGYHILAWDLEGIEIAQWLNSLGVNAAVLKYRVPRRNKAVPHAAPLQDAQRSLRLLRQNADAWGINPKALGILGFSAGGHLTVMTGVSWAETTYPKQDAADELSCRPDFLIPIYPAYLGDEKNAGPLNPLIQVTKETPPVFIAVTHDDALRGLNAASYYIELKKSNVPAELHIYTTGGHGYGMRPTANPVHTWPQRCEDWLRSLKFIPAK